MIFLIAFTKHPFCYDLVCPEVLHLIISLVVNILEEIKDEIGYHSTVQNTTLMCITNSQFKNISVHHVQKETTECYIFVPSIDV
jgi:hypothetical protein